MKRPSADYFETPIARDECKRGGIVRVVRLMLAVRSHPTAIKRPVPARGVAKPWRLYVSRDGERVSSSEFAEEKDARRAYDDAVSHERAARS